MAKEMVYFNATKQIETITIHYNKKLDGTFVEDVAKHIKEIAKKMSRVDLKAPKEFDSIKVFVYPSKKLFYQVFAGEIEKRFYSRKRSLEDLYVVRDSEGNIHIVSPRGMTQEKRDTLKKILVIKVLGEYMDEKQKTSAEKLLKEALKPKLEELEQEQEEIEDEELEQEEEPEEIEEDALEEELDEEELEEIIETELILEQIDDEQNNSQEQENDTKREVVKEEKAKDKEQKQEKKTPSEAQEWLNMGWLMYVKGKLKKKEDIKRFAENISKNGVKKLSKLSHNTMFEKYNYSPEYACAWVEYIVSTYGIKKFAEYYENPKEIKKVFGVPKFVFEGQLKAYIKEKYKLDDKVLKLTEDVKLDEIISEEKIEKEKENPISRIDEIIFSKSGGVDIKSDKEVEKPAIEKI